MDRSQFQRGTGQFNCDVCGRRTRATGVQAIGSKTCPQCWDLAGYYNSHQDGCLDKDGDRPEIVALCQHIVDKGGRLDGDALELLQIVGAPVPSRAQLADVAS
jgi:hypothetical protein